MGLFRPRQPFLQLNAWQNQAVNALHYNTSQQGSVIPLVYGTVRVPVNLVDFADYKGPKGGKGKTGSLPVSGTQSRTAKGGSSKSGKKANPNYSVDVMFALCQGPVTGIGQVYSSAGMGSFGALPLNFYNGADGQAADSVFVGQGSYVGYSGTCMVSATPMNLGPSPVIPNLAAEIIGILAGTNAGDYTNDTNPANLVTDFLTNTRYGAGFPPECLSNLTTHTGSSFAEYCQAVPLLFSTYLDGHQKALDWLDGLCHLCNTAMFFSGKLLKFIPYGDTDLNNNGTTWTAHMTPVYNLTDNDFLPWNPWQAGQTAEPGQEDPIMLTRTNSADADNWLSIEYSDRDNFYNSTTLTVNDQGLTDTYGLRIGDSIQGRAFCSVDSAKASSQLIMQRKAYVRNVPIKFKLGWQFALLEPMDIVSLTGRFGDLYLNQQPVRILSIEEDERGELTVEAEEIQTGLSVPPLVEIYIELDGADGYGQLGPFSFTTPGLTTTQPDDIIMIHVTMLQDAIVPHTFIDDIPRVDSITNSAGLTINPRSGPFAFNNVPCGLGPPCCGAVRTYWAHAPVPLTGATFTLTFNPSGIAVGLVGIAAFKNVNVNVPFDPSSSLPATYNNITATGQWPFVQGVSTNIQNAGVIGMSSCWSALGGGVENINVLNHSSNQQGIQVFDGIFTTACQSWKVEKHRRLAGSQVDFHCGGGRCGFAEPNYWFAIVDALNPRFVY
jgi:hypothetical protein